LNSSKCSFQRGVAEKSLAERPTSAARFSPLIARPIQLEKLDPTSWNDGRVFLQRTHAKIGLASVKMACHYLRR
jgi:hypothetical protein